MCIFWRLHHLNNCYFDKIAVFFSTIQFSKTFFDILKKKKDSLEFEAHIT